jgi:hypothetical protein
MFGINPGLDAFWAGVWFGVVALTAHYLTSVQVDHGPMRYQRWRAAWIMSRDRRAARRAAGMEARYILVLETSTVESGMPPAAIPAPDMDARNSGMPRLSRDLSINDLIVLLSALRGPDGKPRFSANGIHSLVGGDRNTVLALVREVRSGPPAPVFPQRTPEQEAAREALGLKG